MKVNDTLDLTDRLKSAKLAYMNKGENMDIQTKTVTVPLIFFKDHAKRGCVEHSGDKDQYVIKQNSRQITVELDIRDIDELMDDAEYYGSKYGFDRDVVRSVCNSAASTVNALVRQGVERRHPNWRVF